MTIRHTFFFTAAAMFPQEQEPGGRGGRKEGEEVGGSRSSSKVNSYACVLPGLHAKMELARGVHISSSWVASEDISAVLYILSRSVYRSLCKQLFSKCVALATYVCERCVG